MIAGKRKSITFYVIASACLILWGCGEDNVTGPDMSSIKNADLVFAQLVDNLTYISPIRDLSDTTAGTDLGRAAQEEFNFPGAYMRDGDFYVGPMTSGNSIVKYSRNESGAVYESGRMAVSASMWLSGLALKSETKAYASSYNDYKIVIFNPLTMTKTGEIDVSKYSTSDSYSPCPAEAIMRGSKLFVCLHQMESQMTLDTVATVLVIDTETDSVEKMIKDTRASWAGIREGFTNMIIDENNDIYINCSAMFGMITGDGVRAAVLRIKSGETEFDQNYYFSPTETSVEGAAMPTAFYGLVYEGDGKAYGFVTDMSKWGENDDMTTASIFRPVMLDIYSKTAKVLQMPSTNGYGHNVCLYEGRVLYCLYPKLSDPGIYEYKKDGELKQVKSPLINSAGIPVFLGNFTE